MIDPDVRPAVSGDVGQLVELEAIARASIDGRRGADRWLATHPVRAAEWPGTLETAAVAVAHIDVVLVGYLVLSTDGPIANVDEVFVLDEARELGFGDALLDLAIAMARERGCTTLEGASLPGDRETKNLYERAGIKARLITVSTPI